MLHPVTKKKIYKKCKKWESKRESERGAGVGDNKAEDLKIT